MFGEQGCLLRVATITEEVLIVTPCELDFDLSCISGRTTIPLLSHVPNFYSRFASFLRLPRTT